ncbi:MAG: serine hydrolase domain-containing protein, partial [Planctomycetota bacterium]|nr:serine hydrolase domain-containing protein [Planctomycetota bacterium]
MKVSMKIVKLLLFLVLLGPGLLQSADVDVEKLSAYISKARDDWGVPGLAVAIVKDGKLALARGYGSRELGKEKTVDADTLFAIASNSKAFTAAAIAT